MTRRTPEASFLYTQTPDRPPLAAVTRSDNGNNENDNKDNNKNENNININNNNNSINDNDTNLREFVLTPVILETRTRVGGGFVLQRLTPDNRARRARLARRATFRGEM